jgi:transcription elongation factor GreB
MNKAFIKESDEGEEDDLPLETEILPAGIKNYMTPAGVARLRAEQRQLQEIERPKVVDVVTWAAGNGDRSENGDYLYGKKRLREIDRRLRYLAKRLESAEIVDPTRQRHLAQVFFGATVTYADSAGAAHTITLVGIDEADLAEGRVSWLSPIARALHRAEAGDRVRYQAPAGPMEVEVLSVRYGPT